MAYKIPCRLDSRFALFALFMVLPSLFSCGGDSGTTDPEPPVATTVGITPGSQALTAIGATAQLTAEVRDQNGQVMGGAGVTWNSEAPTVVSVTQTGMVTALSEGSATITASAGGATGTSTVTVAQAVSSIAVTPATATIQTGETVQLTAQARDANNNMVDGVTFTWSSQSSTIASVDNSGVVTGSEAGSTTVTATSEGVDGTAEITVERPPIASVEVTGASRVKVGVTYQYTATARLADGTVVDRPMTWSIAPPSKGNMTADGTLTPLETGVITLRVSIDGSVWTAEITAYDWVSLSGGGSLFLTLDADLEITNKFGTSEFPELVFACSQGTGTFLAWVDTEFFVTASGLVSFLFGDGESTSQTWIEFDDFSALGHPGPTNLQTKNFALAMAAVSEFYFAFTEFQGSAKATLFRVTGLANLLPALLDACPSDSLATQREADATVQAYRTLSGKPPTMLDPSVQHQRELRAELGPEDAAIPSLTPAHSRSPDIRTWRMRRR